MNFLSLLYLDTINPLTSYNRLCSLDVLCSIILHTILYLLIIIIITKVFSLKISSTIYKNIVCFLVVVMTLGYVGRLARSKSLYNALLKRNIKQDEAKRYTIDIMNNGYFTYYFLG